MTAMMTATAAPIQNDFMRKSLPMFPTMFPNGPFAAVRHCKPTGMRCKRGPAKAVDSAGIAGALP
jgi:hypothetical protein